MDATLRSIPAALRRVPVSRSKLYQMLKRGEIRSVKVGSRRFIPDSAIEEFLARLEADQADAVWPLAVNTPVVTAATTGKVKRATRRVVPDGAAR